MAQENKTIRAGGTQRPTQDDPAGLSATIAWLQGLTVGLQAATASFQAATAESQGEDAGSQAEDAGSQTATAKPSTFELEVHLKHHNGQLEANCVTSRDGLILMKFTTRDSGQDDRAD